MNTPAISAVTKRRCPRCGEVKPRTRQNFVIRTSKATGKELFRHCKRCSRKEQAELRARPEIHALRVRIDRERRANMTDAERERVNALRQRARERARRRRAKRQGFRNAVRTPVKGSTGQRLPIAPFAAWMRFEFRGWTTVEIGDRLDLDTKTVSRVLSGEQTKVSLVLVDRALTNADCVHLLALWYPIEEESA